MKAADVARRLLETPDAEVLCDIPQASGREDDGTYVLLVFDEDSLEVVDIVPEIATQPDVWTPRAGGGTLTTAPPSAEYRQLGAHCMYHEQAGRTCHNPLDCDFVPIWALTIKAARKRIGGAAR